MILYKENQHYNPELALPENISALFKGYEIDHVEIFYSQYPKYKPTPLHSLPGLAKNIAVKNVYVKDESTRLGLNSFKALGGFYAIARYITGSMGWDYRTTNFEALTSNEVKKSLGKLTFMTATDGNHGKGVAMAASSFGHQAIVYLPYGSCISRIKAIEEVGGIAHVTDLNYDDTVKYAFAEANVTGATVIQDTVLKDYEEIPGWIMQGYTLIAKEIIDSIEQNTITKKLSSPVYPTHIFLQAGVGSMAGSLICYLVERLGNNLGNIILIEPDNAACFFKSACGDGKPAKVEGNLETIMAGLACGEPSPVVWDITRNSVKYFLALPDWVAARGVRVLKNPLAGDPSITAGESGSVGTGLLSLFADNQLSDLKVRLCLDESSTALVINTEGITDPMINRQILWDGKFPTPDQIQWKETV